VECHLSEDDTTPLHLYRRDLRHIVQRCSYGKESWGDAFRLQLEDFAYATQHGGRAKADGRAGVLCAKLVEELYAQRVAMPEPWSLATGGVD